MADIQEAPLSVKSYDVLKPDPHRTYSQSVVVEPSPRRLRIVFNGETVADSAKAMLLHETKHLPIYYLPVEDVRMDLLEKTDHTTHCPFKGDASYWTVKAGGRVAENAVWGYEDPIEGQEALDGLVAFYWDKMDHWYEEDEEIFIHPRDPHKRIDTVPSSRRVQVKVGGEIVADSKRGHFLFETGLPTRYYLPAGDVRMDLLEATDLRTGCPYKGTANYYSVHVGSKTFENIVWFYPDPIPECPKIKDLLCFFNEKVDAILVDGVEIPKVPSPWSDD